MNVGLLRKAFSQPSVAEIVYQPSRISNSSYYSVVPRYDIKHQNTNMMLEIFLHFFDDVL